MITCVICKEQAIDPVVTADGHCCLRHLTPDQAVYRQDQEMALPVQTIRDFDPQQDKVNWDMPNDGRIYMTPEVPTQEIKGIWMTLEAAQRLRDVLVSTAAANPELITDQVFVHNVIAKLNVLIRQEVALVSLG